MSAIPEYPRRHAVTAEEYLRMGEAGIFHPEARLELIEGDIVERANIGPAHGSVLMALNAHFGRAVGERALVAVQSSLTLSRRSIPQPDLVLLEPRADRYFRALPSPSDVLLLVEVCDTTLPFDRGVKAPLYGRAGIRETWIIDIPGRSLTVFRDPDGNGYATSFTVSGSERVSVLALPETTLAPEALFPSDPA